MDTVFVAIVTSAVTAFFTGRLDQARWKREFEMDQNRMRSEFMAEQVARKLLEVETWKMRSFAAIRSRIDGFDDQELRRILVRSGAVRFEGSGGEEMWGLLSRNPEALT